MLAWVCIHEILLKLLMFTQQQVICWFFHVRFGCQSNCFHFRWPSWSVFLLDLLCGQTESGLWQSTSTVQNACCWLASRWSLHALQCDGRQQLRGSVPAVDRSARRRGMHQLRRRTSNCRWTAAVWHCWWDYRPSVCYLQLNFPT